MWQLPAACFPASSRAVLRQPLREVWLLPMSREGLGPELLAGRHRDPVRLEPSTGAPKRMPCAGTAWKAVRGGGAGEGVSGVSHGGEGRGPLQAPARPLAPGVELGKGASPFDAFSSPASAGLKTRGSSLKDVCLQETWTLRHHPLQRAHCHLPQPRVPVTTTG